MTDAMTPNLAPEALCTVACPQCGAGYQVPVAKLAEKPRKLKCAQCAQVWLASLPEPAIEPTPTVPVVEPEAATPAPEPVAEAVPEPDATSEAPAEPTDDIPPPAPLALDEVLTPAWQAYVFGEQKWLTLAMLMVLAGLGAAVAALRVSMQHSVPEETDVAHAPLTKAHTLKPVTAPQGVILHKVEAHGVQVPEGVMLTLQGRIANTSKQTTALPHLQAELLDDSGVVQDFWPVTLVTTTLPAQTELPFAVSFTNPLGQGWRLVWVN